MRGKTQTKKHFGSPCLFDQLMTPKLRNRKYRKGNRRFYFYFILLFGEEEEEEESLYKEVAVVV
jgi:hypothetical protein